jgi:hypothetical protein
MIASIIALALQAVSLGTGIWSASIPMDRITDVSTENSLTGDLAQAGYQSGVSAGINSETTRTERFEEGKTKKTLGNIAKWSGVGASVAGSASSMADAKVPVGTEA